MQEEGPSTRGGNQQQDHNTDAHAVRADGIFHPAMSRAAVLGPDRKRTSWKQL